MAKAESGIYQVQFVLKRNISGSNWQQVSDERYNSSDEYSGKDWVQLKKRVGPKQNA